MCHAILTWFQGGAEGAWEGLVAFPKRILLPAGEMPAAEQNLIKQKILCPVFLQRLDATVELAATKFFGFFLQGTVTLGDKQTEGKHTSDSGSKV